MAARPEANAKPAVPSSKSATQRSKANRVGFCVRRTRTLVNAGRLLRVGAGRVDRRHDRAGSRVGRLAGVDGPRGKIRNALNLRRPAGRSPGDWHRTLELLIPWASLLLSRFVLATQETQNVDTRDQAVELVAVGHDRHQSRVENRQQFLELARAARLSAASCS